jgi:hypothetical protein
LLWWVGLQTDKQSLLTLQCWAGVLTLASMTLAAAMAGGRTEVRETAGRSLRILLVDDHADTCAAQDRLLHG